jgi:hypothetical protein
VENPIQPLITDENGVLRFKLNEIVRYLLDSHPTCSLNELAMMSFSEEDRQQFAQLIGYSLSGYGELPYVDDYAYESAEMVAENTEAEDKCRIAVLESDLAALRVALREPIARLYGIHPDDLAKPM